MANEVKESHKQFATLCAKVTSKRHIEQKPFGPSVYSKYLPGSLTQDTLGLDSLERDLSTSYLPSSSYDPPDDHYKVRATDFRTETSGLRSTEILSDTALPVSLFHVILLSRTL